MATPSNFDLYTQQGKWREWDKLFDHIMKTYYPSPDKPAPMQDSPTSIVVVPPRTALDIGCSTGFSTRALYKRGGFSRVVGLDADDALVEKARTLTTAMSALSDDVFNITYESASDIANWDAFGERFDFIFSGYTLAYLGDVTPVLKQWASLLKPGGMLVVLEIQGLFAVHHPLGPSRPWFERFDLTVLQGFGYNSSAGAVMDQAIHNVPDVAKIACVDWRDAELSFDGPLAQGSPVWLGWEERWRRLWPLMNQAGVEEGLHEAFFRCLSHPEHRCDKPVRLLIAMKNNGNTSNNVSPKLARVPADEEVTVQEQGDLTVRRLNNKVQAGDATSDAFYPGESGGGDDD